MTSPSVLFLLCYDSTVKDDNYIDDLSYNKTFYKSADCNKCKNITGVNNTFWNTLHGKEVKKMAMT